jgi:hypothetical protein
MAGQQSLVVQLVIGLDRTRIPLLDFYYSPWLGIKRKPMARIPTRNTATLHIMELYAQVLRDT